MLTKRDHGSRSDKLRRRQFTAESNNFRPAQLSSVRQIGTELLTGTAQFDVAAAAILP